MSNGKKNILLVGGAGYLGSHLKELLSLYNVFYTSRTKKPGAIELDLLKKETFDNIASVPYDLIILLASSLKGLGTSELDAAYLDTDTTGLSGFLQFISVNKLSSKLIYVSSMTVYGKKDRLPVKEDAVPEPISTYGLSKVLGETIFGFYCNSGAARGVILRIPGIYGGQRKSGFIYNTAMKCAGNEPLEMDTSGLGYWETIHIHDLSTWISEFIRNYTWEENINTFNIGYGIKTDFIECAGLIRTMLESSSEIQVRGAKGYTDFYLDNSKIKKYASVTDNYQASLKNYLKGFRS
ncbi:MAG: NDP-sugar dehydratase or epimerase [Bacteroidetes bacterium]|nr:NDP-sugar dehydratase or epimerase [Bacteroidota bacterium]